ncbi:hypothetical protein JTE90_017812 [Oedothorax gibbosus]|uniref:Uncharacterized protein n=1 Tax=Oedothorax gibbosus TaxID=931172 RepID=A0AAV6U746_9ARAC|nr:hypothetical protein JTE90_017812 [Oedothorax gibbosus]
MGPGTLNAAGIIVAVVLAVTVALALVALRDVVTFMIGLNLDLDVENLSYLKNLFSFIVSVDINKEDGQGNLFCTDRLLELVDILRGDALVYEVLFDFFGGMS